MRISQLAERERPLDFEFEGETLHLVYRRGAVNAQNIAEPADQFLSHVLVSWDLLGDDGEPIPLTPEAIRSLIELAGAEAKAFIEDLAAAVTRDAYRLDPPTSASSDAA